MAQMAPVISTDWLASQLTNSQVVIVDCRFQLGNPAWGYQQYLASHVPGAFYLDLERDLSAPLQGNGGRHPLPSPSLLADKFREIGITAGETLVVAYDDSRFAFAARLWWLLRYLGHDAAAVLDGGWQAWQAGGYPTTRDLPSPQLGKFTPQIRSDWIVDLPTVKARKDLSSVVLVDSRVGERYRGEWEPIDPIPGHIPGAVNSSWQQVTDEEGFLRPLTDQKLLWTEFENAEEIIVYCGSGVTACTNLLSLELARIRNAKLYPGGWSDWCSYGDWETGF